MIREENLSPGLFASDIRECKAKRFTILEKEYQGVFLASSGRAGKNFKTKKRNRIRNNKITSLQAVDKIVSEQTDIEKELVDTFSELLSERKHVDETTLEEFLQVMPEIPHDISEKINGEIIDAEIEAAIKELKAGKSPGVDGLGLAFYKKFSSLLTPMLRNVYEDFLKRNLLPPLMRQALTVLIPKKHAASSVTKADNLRPISLLTTDYKILAKILTKHLDHGLGVIVGDHKHYGIKGRSITSNAHTMRIICETAEAQQHPIVVLQVDLSKAVDRVSHFFLFALLERCRLGD